MLKGFLPDDRGRSRFNGLTHVPVTINAFTLDGDKEAA